MNQTRGLLAMVLVLAGAMQLPATEHGDVSAAELLQEMEETLFPDVYRMRMSMLTREASGREREMVFAVAYARGTGTYMEIEQPPRSRGTRILQRDDDMWMFMPRSNSRSAIRLAARDSFQGSVFANRDIGESMYSEDYQAEILGREMYARGESESKVEVYRVELTPRREAAAYGRIETLVSVEGFIPLQMDYYVRSGMHVKTMRLSDVQEIAGRRRPLRMEMESFEEAGKVSIVRILELEAVDGLPDRMFTRRYLTR